MPEIRHSAKIPLPWEALPSGVTLGKEFAECKLAFAECNRHSAKPVNPVVVPSASKYKSDSRALKNSERRSSSFQEKFYKEIVITIEEET